MRAVLLFTLLSLGLASASTALAQVTGPEPGLDVPSDLDLPGVEDLPGVRELLEQDLQDLPEPRPVPETPRAAPPPAPAERADEEPPKPPEPVLSREERLDKLFAELKREPDAAAAGRIARRIESEWATSGSATVDLLVGWAGQAIAKDDKAAALDLLGEAIAMKPDYAESWNRRATLHFLADDYGKSLADIEQTLRHEPRHYGALMGLGAILEETDRKAQALDAYTRALDVYPAMKSAQDAVGRLSEELAGRAI